MIFFGLFCFQAQSQTIERFNTFNYNVNEGLLQSTIIDIAYDKNNFCWLSFPNGIQKFDGKNITNVPVQPGLPDDKLVLFFRCANGDLLISHSYGISKYEIDANRFVQVHDIQPGDNVPAKFIGEDENIIYIYKETGYITGLNQHNFKVISENPTGLSDYITNNNSRVKLSDNIIDHKITILHKSVLYLWDLQKGKVVSAPLTADIPSNLLKMKTGTEVIYCQYKINNALQVYNFSSRTKSSIAVKEEKDRPLSRCIIFPWKKKTLVSFSNRLYESGTSLGQLISELVDFQNKPVAGMSDITRIREDNFGNLMIGTLNTGLVKVIRNNYPVKYYGTEKKEGNFVVSVLPDKKNNRILAGTVGNGLLIFDTLQQPVKHIKTLPGRTLPFTLNAIVKNNPAGYTLFVLEEKDAWYLSEDLLRLKPVKMSTSLNYNNSGIGFFTNLLYKNEKEAVIQSEGRIFTINFITNKITEQESSHRTVLGSIRFKTSVVTHANDELIFMDARNYKTIKKIPFKNTGGVRCFASGDNNHLYIGSNKGIFETDSTGKVLMHLKKEDGLPDECIYAMQLDDRGFLWCSTNKGIFKLNKDNSILLMNRDDGLQENEFNTNVAARADDGELFFGGVNGVSSFYPAAISSFSEEVNLFFTKIKINNEDAFKDTAVWNIKKINLPYNQNTLSFDFVAMANNNPGQYIYQYKMEAIDNGWIQNTDLQTVRYFLPPGEYIFKIYASRNFDKDAKAMKEIRIIINPPFWNTWWFFSAMALLFVAALAYAINRYNRNAFEKKLMVLENEHKLQLEKERISRDLHDSIGAYANAVLYNTELLQQEVDVTERNELMKDLKFASKDIITSLRETIWALKKDNYTAEDCLMRIKNFIQPFTRYYSGIKFTVEGDAPPGKNLHYVNALNLVRIVQEAVNNAIKHTAAGQISIISQVMDGRWQMTVSDDGKGFDYEKARESESGNGLLNMKQRADDSGFEFNMISHTDTGTTIRILI